MSFEDLGWRHDGRGLRTGRRVSARRGRATVDDFLASLRLSPEGPAEARRPPEGVTAHLVEPARAARPGDWPGDIDLRVQRALAKRGIVSPYVHQERAMRLAGPGRAVVVVSPTASGKSLCYAAPIASRCLRDPDARALLLFPTKALALDQAGMLGRLVEDVRAEGGETDLLVSTFDGDTPADVRREVRRRGRIVVSNPDMLHSGVLPHHARWASFFEGLTHVVIDEIHAYRGVFGSHLANVLRRLQRIAAFHGSRPTYVLCSATIANPREHAEALLGRDVELVEESGAPRGRRHVVLWQPPVLDARLGLRASAVGTARRLAERSMAAGLQTIVFATSRLNVELLTRYLKDGLARSGLDPRLVEGYRGGYLPDRRRRIQHGLAEGRLRGVVATSALELGLDVGSLDVAILCGHPGTIASAWQQMGRAGRRQGTHACFLIARASPLDQYVVSRPEFFFGASPEHARVDPDNLLVLADHLKCAAFELPFRQGEAFGGLSSEDAGELLGVMQEEGLVHAEGGVWHWTDESHPAEAVSLRSAAQENFVVVDTTRSPPRVIAEVDEPSAPTTIHEQAIYLLAGRQYQVERLDYPNRKAFVRAVDCDYFTDAMTYRHVAVLEVFEEAGSRVPTVSTEEPAAEPGGEPAGAHARPALVTSRHGDVRVSRKVVGFKKVRLYTMENLGYGDVVLPEHEMHVTAAWWTLERAAVERLTAGGLSRREIVQALVGASHALRVVASVLLACDPRDLGTAIGDARGTAGRGRWFVGDGRGASELHAPEAPEQALSADTLEVFEPTLFLHEMVPGGSGFAPLLFDRRAILFGHALGLVRGCSCEAGCPACVGPPLEVGERCWRDAQAVLEVVLEGLGVGGGERAHADDGAPRLEASAAPGFG